MTTHAYGSRPHGKHALLRDDAAIVLALVVLAWITWGSADGSGSHAIASALAFAVPVVVGWSVWTLHFPSRIDVDDDAITFHRWGRAHRYAWDAVERVRVRRFLVGDRVLVVVSPSPAWRGRYWILRSIDGFDRLVARLEERARSTQSTRGEVMS